MSVALSGCHRVSLLCVTVAICHVLPCTWVVGWVGYVDTVSRQPIVELCIEHWLILRCLTFFDTFLSLFKVPYYKLPFLLLRIEPFCFLKLLNLTEITVTGLGAWFCKMEWSSTMLQVLVWAVVICALTQHCHVDGVTEWWKLSTPAVLKLTIFSILLLLLHRLATSILASDADVLKIKNCDAYVLTHSYKHINRYI